MSSIKGKNTSIELMVRKKLWALGFRYRLNVKIEGKPDLFFPRKKVVVFLDGDFWHGRDIREVSLKKFRNKNFWLRKIERNIQRDKEVNESLKNQGYTVIRIWENEIKNDLEGAILKITSHLTCE